MRHLAQCLGVWGPEFNSGVHVCHKGLGPGSMFGDGTSYVMLVFKFLGTIL